MHEIKTRKLIKILESLGFKELRQKGSHKFFEHVDGRTTVVPMHSEIRIKLLTKIIKQDLKMNMKEFQKLM